MIVSQKIFSITTVLLACNITFAQAIFYPFRPANITAARYAKSSVNSLVAVFNPATAIYIKGIEAGVYTEKRYMTDIHVLALSAGMAFGKNGLGVLLQHFGTTSYSEKTAALIYAKRLGKIGIGIGVSHTGINVQHHDKTGIIQTVVSSVLELTEEFSSSVTIFNPNVVFRSSENGAKPAGGYAFGIGWQGSPVVYTGIEVLKQESLPLAVMLNLQYQFAKEFSAIINWSTFTNQPGITLGWKRKQIKFEAGGSYHSALGVSPTVSISFEKETAAE